ncbi:hypothetical protein NPIL_327231 [Nephila pilipes]|uniref:Uncharacterized protein n=1 Tax=Nephila pilipes TaxID=299642 RepID=A0A8X6TQG1_NEPPI|nr:hypothetical protein NPIL_327231 [Nephila pilipes]
MELLRPMTFVDLTSRYCVLCCDYQQFGWRVYRRARKRSESSTNSQDLPSLSHAGGNDSAYSFTTVTAERIKLNGRSPVGHDQNVYLVNKSYSLQPNSLTSCVRQRMKLLSIHPAQLQHTLRKCWRSSFTIDLFCPTALLSNCIRKFDHLYPLMDELVHQWNT